ncbi:MAG TPA: hypothetical protein ENL21_00295, partial [Caldithrix abyssi]|nr:hypothetical protein [Caldithrix abyssi]
MPNEEPRRDEIKDFWKTLKIRFYELSDPVINIVNISLFFVSVAALISLILEYGFYISEQTAHIIERVNILIVLYYVLQYFVKLLFNIKKWNYIKTHWFETALVILIIAETTFVLHQLGFSQFQKYLTDLNVKALTRLTIVGAQVVIILTIISGAVRLNRKIAYLRFHPAQTFMLSFFVVIVLGTFLLMLPRSVAPGHTLSWLDALFT